MLLIQNNIVVIRTIKILPSPICLAFSFTGIDIKTMEKLSNYFTGKGYAVKKEYVIDTGSYSPHDPQYYQDNTLIPPEIQKPGFSWDGSSGSIIDSLNSGAVLLAHRDHGDPTSWYRPQFRTFDLSNLNTGTLCPLVFSINCFTGHFDNDNSLLPKPRESLAENFLTTEGGALAVIAATRETHPILNDYLLWAMIEYLWADFYFERDIDLSPKKHLGDVLNIAKFYVVTHWMDTPYSPGNAPTTYELLREFELYHCLGDPTLEISLGKAGEPDFPLPCPSNITVPATGSLTPVTYPGITVPDDFMVQYNPPSGSGFPVGSTIVTSAVTNPQGDVRRCSFTVTVRCVEGSPGVLDVAGTSVLDSKINEGKQKEVRVPVRIQAAPKKLSSFAFEVTYEAKIRLIEYSGYEQGNIADQLTRIKVDQVNPGRLKIECSSSPEAGIPAGAQGELIWLKFNVLGSLKKRCSPLHLEKPTGDLSGLSLTGGCLCSCFSGSENDGDLNGDNVVTPVDVLIIISCYLETGFCSECADINQDGNITPADALCLLRKYLMLPSCLN